MNELLPSAMAASATADRRIMADNVALQGGMLETQLPDPEVYTQFENSLKTAA